MAQRSAYTIRVEGLREFQRNVRSLRDKELNKAVREANKASGEVLIPQAKQESPDGQRDAKSSKKYRPGKLDKSIKVTASVKGAVIKAGSAARVPYAAAIHFGWKAHNIKPNRFLFRAMARKSDAVAATYERRIDAVVRKFLES
ncbi:MULTISPECIES: HK97 gp10 family phage protein [unclassified Streptomyces]|uniref:HK97 gp10 family phage protein n=1 Tax=unclassified Streptomyces TaxID=2593676 RepID=UPI0004BE5C7C|nr:MULTISPECIES: HK97 gp10 family phage protein [unclassified Streptomyces]